MTPEPALALSPRLAAAAAFVPEGARAADVGCDHGRLARHLAASGRCARVVATEIDEVALARARRSAGEASARTDRISWRAGDGLEPIRPDEGVDTIVVAGLGAAAIVRILNTPRLAAIAPRRLVVQPQTETALLRRWLVDHGWAFVNETVARDRGRLYEIAAVEPGDGHAVLSDPELSPDDVLAVGPVLLRSGGRDARDLWRRRLRRLDRIVATGARGEMAERAAREGARARRILERWGDRPLTSRGG